MQSNTFFLILFQTKIEAYLHLGIAHVAANTANKTVAMVIFMMISEALPQRMLELPQPSPLYIRPFPLE